MPRPSGQLRTISVWWAASSTTSPTPPGQRWSGWWSGGRRSHALPSTCAKPQPTSPTRWMSRPRACSPAPTKCVMPPPTRWSARRPCSTVLPKRPSASPPPSPLWGRRARPRSRTCASRPKPSTGSCWTAATGFPVWPTASTRASMKAKWMRDCRRWPKRSMVRRRYWSRLLQPSMRPRRTPATSPIRRLKADQHNRAGRRSGSDAARFHRQPGERHHLAPRCRSGGRAAPDP